VKWSFIKDSDRTYSLDILYTMKKRNLIALCSFLSFYIAFGIFLTLNQEAVVYQPFPQDFTVCQQLATAERVTYQGTRMYVELVAEAPTVVLYHGNAGSACDRYLYADIFKEAGLGYLLVEYAGYSNDAIPPSHERIKQDVKNVISYLEEYTPAPILLIGESIGTGAASYHTSLSPPERLLLIAPFTDLEDVAKKRFWFYPTSLLVDNAFNNVTALESYRGETTIIHGTADRIIPYELGESLFESLEGPRTLVPITDAGHNNLFSFPATYEALQEFLKETPY